jgi:hypothetical protein
MRKLLAIAVIALTAAFGAGVSEAQVRVKPIVKPNVMVMPKTPKAARVKPVAPKVKVIPPSVAVRQALGLAPGAKPLGVKLRNETYIVRLKSGNTIKQVGVNSVTGAVSAIP